MGVLVRRISLLTLAASLFALSAGIASAQAPVDPIDPVGAVEAAPAPVAGSGEDPAVPPPVGDEEVTPPAPAPLKDAEVKLRLKGLKNGRLNVGNRFKALGTISPYVAGQKVNLIVRRGKKTIKRKVVKPKVKKGTSIGRFKIAQKQVKPGRYSVQAVHKKSKKQAYGQDKTKGFKIRYPSLRKGNRSTTVRLFNSLLAKQGYVNDEGKAFDDATARAVLAYRKVNKMSRNSKVTGKIFKKLADGRGGYKLKYPGSGKHVELDISRQVMVLAKGKKVDEIYHVSTGAAATPTPPGTWRFYRKEPGLNNVEMYYSVYWNRGYATHGYKSVPTYPASHGCARNPPADAVHIYNWIDIGDKIHIYR